MAQDGRGKIGMSDNEQIVADLIWSHVEKPENHLFTKAHNVYDNRYRINAFGRVWMGEDGDLEGQKIEYSALVQYDRETHKLGFINQTGDVDYKGLLKDAVAKSGVHTFTSKEETVDGPNFSLKK